MLWGVTRIAIGQSLHEECLQPLGEHAPQNVKLCEDAKHVALCCDERLHNSPVLLFVVEDELVRGRSDPSCGIRCGNEPLLEHHQLLGRNHLAASTA
jgi:hypothetical protein